VVVAGSMAVSYGIDTNGIIFGTLVTFAFSCTMVVAGLKAGITPGVSPLVVLCGWGAFRQASHGMNGSRFLNLAQVAGSAGMAIVTGVIFSEPLLQVLHLNDAQASLNKQGVKGDLFILPWKDAQELMKSHGLSIPEVSISTNILACVAGSLVGYGFVGLTTRKFLADPTLPAPEARACMSLIKAAVTDCNERPKLGVSLVLSILASLFMRILATMSLAVNNVVIWSKSMGDRTFGVTLPFDSGALYLGIGGLLTVPTALLTFAGAFLRLVGDYLLAQDLGHLEDDFPSNSMRWVGGGAMTVAVAYSLIKFAGQSVMKPAAGGAEDASDDSLLEIGKRNQRGLMVSIANGVVALAVWLFATEGLSPFSFLMLVAFLMMAMVMVPLGAILSLQIGSSCSPVSGTVFVTTLVLCLVALATGHSSIGHVPTITTMLVAASVAVSAANDVSQDYKTLQLCGVPPRDGFLAQIIGLLVGSVVVPVSLYISANAFGLGTERLPAPQGQMFATLVEGLLIERHLPWYPIIVGLGIGIVAVGVDLVGGRFGCPLPAMALAVGIYLSPDTGVGILIGSVCRTAGELLRARWTGGVALQTHECILASAGMITGSAFLDLVLGIAVLFNFDLGSLKWFSSTGVAGKIQVPLALSNTIAVFGIAFLGWILFYNSSHGVCEGEETLSKVKAQSASPDEDSVELNMLST